MTDNGKRIYTPLRYPGGKSRLTRFFKNLLRENKLYDVHYVEPYAGGAGIALSLLLTEYASHIYLNDINYPLYCFWNSILDNTEFICRRIRDVRVSPATWRRQRQIIRHSENYTIDEVGFAFFFLNRTNRSGIPGGGMIGGETQKGEWKIDARFNKKELISRIEKIAEFSHRISLYNLDAKPFLERIVSSLPRKSLIYLDPPYYVNGKRLYTNYYTENDHCEIAILVQHKLTHPWIITYDNQKEIYELYRNRKMLAYNINYSANKCRSATELMIFADSISIPEGKLKGKIYNQGNNERMNLILDHLRLTT